MESSRPFSYCIRLRCDRVSVLSQKTKRYSACQSGTPRLMATRASLFVVGRIKKIGSALERKGHSVMARSGDRLLASSKTDGTGRFLLEWPDDPGEDGITIELLDGRGAVSESVVIPRAELSSPPIVAFTGEGVVGFSSSREENTRRDRFEADGDYPITVSPACQEVTLYWVCPEDSRVSIVSEGETPRSGLPSSGSLKVAESRSRAYTRRVWPAGAAIHEFSDRTVEVLRYPSLSLVLYGLQLWTPGQGEFGASTSCPAGEEGLTVVVTSSDKEMVPDFQIPVVPGSNWATSRVPLGPKKGVVKLTASAPGFARDEVTFTTR